MKKIFALILAIVMIASMSVVVFAAESSAQVKNDATDSNGLLPGGTVLTYGVAEAYTVVIPADQSFVKNEAASAEDKTDAYIATAAISASGVKVAGNEKFVISIDSANDWFLTDTNRASLDVAYTAYTTVGEAAPALLADGGMIFDVASTTAVDGGVGSATLTFYTAGTGQEGNYVDTLTFIVSMGAVTQG